MRADERQHLVSSAQADDGRLRRGEPGYAAATQRGRDAVAPALDHEFARLHGQAALPQASEDVGLHAGRDA